MFYNSSNKSIYNPTCTTENRQAHSLRSQNAEQVVSASVNGSEMNGKPSFIKANSASSVRWQSTNPDFTQAGFNLTWVPSSVHSLTDGHKSWKAFAVCINWSITTHTRKERPEGIFTNSHWKMGVQYLRAYWVHCRALAQPPLSMNPVTYIKTLLIHKRNLIWKSVQNVLNLKKEIDKFKE